MELMDKVRRNRPGDDLELLRRAYDFAAEQHKTQTRLSGEPFLSHPVEVAHILADMKLDVTSMCAALLHDVVEDTKIPLEHDHRAISARMSRACGGHHQNQPPRLARSGSAPGRERPQDASGHGQRCSGRGGEAGRPPAQHAHAELSGSGKAAAHRPRNSRHLRAGRQPIGDGLDSRRTRGSFVSLSRARKLISTLQKKLAIETESLR